MTRNVLVTMPMTEDYRREIEAAAPGWKYTYVLAKELTGEDVENQQVVLGNMPVALLPRARALEWLQLNNAGTEGFTRDTLPRGAKLTNASGAYGIAISEHIIGMLLALMKRLYTYRENQNERVWRDEGPVTSIDGATVLIAGAGDIGLAAAKRFKAFGATVLAMRKTRGELPEYVDEYVPPEALDEALPRADVVLIALPGNEETRGLFSRARIARMKTGAYLLNVGRGIVADTEALADALEAGKLAGAALDVTDPEPLPKEHRLWGVRNAAITPHVSGQYHLRATLDRIVKLSAENLRRFAAGEALYNQVDLGSGYRLAATARREGE